MKAITNKIVNNKEVIIIGITIMTFVGLIVYNILVHGIH
jgi:hypothetical protein